MSTDRTTTDAELMLLVKSGVTDALGELFRRHHQRVYAFCYRMLGDGAMAEDVCQEVFLRVLRFSRGYRARAAFATWVLRIARNSCLDVIGRRERERRQLAAQRDESQAASAGPDDEEEARVQEALARLAPKDREVLVLSRYHDLPVAAIAEVCGASVSAVKVRIHRALRRLRDAYRTLEHEDHGLSDRPTADYRRHHG